MNRTLLNVLIDIAAAGLFLAMIATGYILRFPYRRERISPLHYGGLLAMNGEQFILGSALHCWALSSCTWHCIGSGSSA